MDRGLHRGHYVGWPNQRNNRYRGGPRSRGAANRRSTSHGQSSGHHNGYVERTHREVVQQDHVHNSCRNHAMRDCYTSDYDARTEADNESNREGSGHFTNRTFYSRDNEMRRGGMWRLDDYERQRWAEQHADRNAGNRKRHRCDNQDAPCNQEQSHFGSFNKDLRSRLAVRARTPHPAPGLSSSADNLVNTSHSCLTSATKQRPRNEIRFHDTQIDRMPDPGHGPSSSADNLVNTSQSCPTWSTTQRPRNEIRFHDTQIVRMPDPGHGPSSSADNLVNTSQSCPTWSTTQRPRKEVCSRGTDVIMPDPVHGPSSSADNLVNTSQSCLTWSTTQRPRKDIYSPGTEIQRVTIPAPGPSSSAESRGDICCCELTYPIRGPTASAEPRFVRHWTPTIPPPPFCESVLVVKPVVASSSSTSGPLDHHRKYICSRGTETVRVTVPAPGPSSSADNRETNSQSCQRSTTQQRPRTLEETLLRCRFMWADRESRRRSRLRSLKKRLQSYYRSRSWDPSNRSGSQRRSLKKRPQPCNRSRSWDPSVRRSLPMHFPDFTFLRKRRLLDPEIQGRLRKIRSRPPPVDVIPSINASLCVPLVQSTSKSLSSLFTDYYKDRR